MGVNKVVYGGRVVVDLSGATITPETVLDGYIGYGANGEQIVGTATTAKHFARNVTLPVSGWADNRQTVAVSGILADGEKCTVIVGPDWSSADVCAVCGVDCVAQGNGSLTFQCSFPPDEDVVMNVSVLI